MIYTMPAPVPLWQPRTKIANSARHVLPTEVNRLGTSTRIVAKIDARQSLRRD